MSDTEYEAEPSCKCDLRRADSYYGCLRREYHHPAWPTIPETWQTRFCRPPCSSTGSLCGCELGNACQFRRDRATNRNPFDYVSRIQKPMGEKTQPSKEYKSQANEYEICPRLETASKKKCKELRPGPIFEILPTVTVAGTTRIVYENAYKLDGCELVELENDKDGYKYGVDIDRKKIKASIKDQPKPCDKDIIYGEAKMMPLYSNWETPRSKWLRDIEGNKPGNHSKLQISDKWPKDAEKRRMRGGACKGQKSAGQKKCGIPNWFKFFVGKGS